MPRPYPKEFRDDVVRVARNREDGVTIEQIAADFGIHPMTLSKWMRQADVDDGAKPGLSRTESVELPWVRPGHRDILPAHPPGQANSDQMSPVPAADPGVLTR